MPRKGLSVTLLACGSGLFLVLYLCSRVYFFVTTATGFPDSSLAALILLAECYALVQALGYLLGVYRLEQHPPRYRHAHVADEELPEVAVIVPVKNEPLHIVEETLITLAALNYPKKHCYLIDGSTDIYLKEQTHELTMRYGISHVFPRVVHTSKAGSVNEFLRSTTTEYIAIFDADQRPMPNFLMETVTLALAAPKAAYIQTPQVYANFSASRIAKGAAMQHSIFYEVVCEAKQAVGAAFCCGTNVLLRRSALLSVGGFDERSVTEDFATSLYLHLKGYRSIYYNHVLAFGMAPITLGAFFTQQMRWATGTIGVVRPLVREFIRAPRALRLSQWWEYFLSATYYFIGWSFLILALGPVAFLLTGLPTYYTHPAVYLGTFLPYMLLNMCMFYLTLRRRRYTFGNLIYGIILSSLSFPILVQASIAGLRNKRVAFQVTPKGGSAKLPLWSLAPWILLILLNVLAIGVGVFKFTTEPYAIGVNMFWCLYHVVIVSQIFRLNEDTRVAPAPKHSVQ